MQKKNKTACLWLAICLVITLICMIFANLIQTDFGKVEVVTAAFEVGRGNDEPYTITYKMYVPKEASAENPLPALLCLHGYQNDRETSAAYAMEAVAWGVENGIINGYEDNTFRPNQTISRAQMATFMARYIVSEFGPTDAATEASFGFVDEASFAAAYAESINVIANLGIMNGVDKAPTFNPNGTATRGMAATVLARPCAWRWSQIVDTTTTAA